jgi:hypothetical protein
MPGVKPDQNFSLQLSRVGLRCKILCHRADHARLKEGVRQSQKPLGTFVVSKSGGVTAALARTSPHYTVISEYDIDTTYRLLSLCSMMMQGI